MPLAVHAAGGPETVEAPPHRGSELEELYAAGEASFHAGDLDAAVAAFSAGLDKSRALPRLRVYFSVSLAIAHLDRYDRSGDPADAQRASDLVTAAIDRDSEVLTAEPRLDALARRNLERARSYLRRQADAAPEREDAQHGVAAKRDAATRRATATPERPRGDKPIAVLPEPAAILRDRRVGIGLLVSGTAVVAGSLAVMIDAATLRRRALTIAEDPPTPRQQKYIDEEVPKLARIRYGIAGPFLAVGIGLCVGGGLALRRAARKRVVLAPDVEEHRWGLWVHTTF